MFQYDDRQWESFPTRDNGNSCFHAIFGVKADDDQCYTDKAAMRRRMNLTNFLSYHETRSKPKCLTDALQPYYEERGWSIESEENFKEYVKEIEQGRQIRTQELAVLASLENVNILLFTDIQSTPKAIKPVPEMLESYPLMSKSQLSRAVIFFNGTTYLKLIPRSTQTDDKETKDVASFRRDPGTIAGILFEINLLSIVLLNVFGKYDHWRLSASNKGASYFDDVVVEWGPKNEAMLVQARQRRKIVSEGDLLANKYSGFSLCKYFLAYQKLKSSFNVSNVVLCTNVTINLKELREFSNKRLLDEGDLLYLEGVDCECYTFQDGLAQRLSNTFSCHEPFEQHKFTEDNIKSFLKHFQLVILPLKDEALEQAIERKIFSMGLSGKFDRTDYARHLNKKIIDWFDRSSEYLTPLHAKVIFCGLRSDKLVEKLNNLEIGFKPDRLHLPTAKRLLHLVPQNDNILSLLRVCKCLENEKSKALYLSTSTSPATQTLTAEAFESIEYSFLVVYVTREIREVQKLCASIVGVLKKFKNKKVVLIGDQADSLVNKLKKDVEGGFEMIHDNIIFTDFSERSQKELLERAISSCEANL